ncbi:hypothetical protein BH09ACT7_BH09ACT7_08500 [soil metagenome]
MTQQTDNAQTWRDLTDQLTPEQIGRIERQEAQALHSIAVGKNVYESPEDIARCFLADARYEADGNLMAAVIGLPLPAGAESVEHWEDDGTGAMTRQVHARPRTIDGCDATAYLTGTQSADGAVAWGFYVHVDDRANLTASQTRELARALMASADELERLK